MGTLLPETITFAKNAENTQMMQLKTLSESALIKVQFFKPRNGHLEWYFGSLAAIYELFTPEEIGCKLETLWAAGLKEGDCKATRQCTVYKLRMFRKMQKKL